MWLGIILLVLVMCLNYAYGMYFKEYFEVRKVYNTLQKVLDTRDVLLLKLSGEKIDKKMLAKIIMLIDERKKTKDAGYTIRMNADVLLSNELRSFYPKLSKVLDNDLTKEVFRRIMELEKSAKKIRINFNNAVERYNNNLILHKRICMKIIRMKPLDIYKI